MSAQADTGSYSYESLGPGLQLVEEESTLRPLDGRQQALVERHLYLVPEAVEWAARKQGRLLDREEAALDAAVGLCDAARLYDVTRQVLFSTYAPPRVRGALIDGQRQAHRLGGVDRKEAQVVSLFNNTNARSLDAPLIEGTSFTLYDVLETGERTDEAGIDQTNLADFYGSLDLSERQKMVLYLKARRYQLAEIGDLLGVSARTVSREYQVACGAAALRNYRIVFDEQEIQ